MRRRILKQAVIALIYLILLSGVVFLIYYSNRPEPSCFDNICNQGEEEVDCGGPCIPCELMHIKPLEVLWTGEVLVEDNLYDLSARIKNPNQNYGSASFVYSFELRDSEGNLIDEYSDLTFILPNQTKHLVNTRVSVNGKIARIKLSFGNIEWQRLENCQIPELAVHQKKYRLLDDSQPGESQVSAILVNKTDFDFDEVNIDILLFDAYHHLLGLNTHEVKTLLAGQERDFFATWFRKIDGQVSFVEIEAETNIFDNDNYLSPEAKKERFQEY